MEKSIDQLKTASATSESLSAFQEVIKKSFSEVVSSISSFGASSSTAPTQSIPTSNLATKDDIQLVLAKLTSIEKKQEAFDSRLTALECRPQAEILKRIHDDQDPDDHVGEKRRRICESERVDIRVQSSENVNVSILEQTSEQAKETDSEQVKETENSEEVLVIISESSKEEDVPNAFVDEGYEVDTAGYETQQIDLDSANNARSVETEKVQDSDEEMINEYLANEEVIGEPGDLSDVIMFLEDSSESDEEVVVVENNERDMVVWYRVNMAEIARELMKGF